MEKEETTDQLVAFTNLLIVASFFDHDDKNHLKLGCVKNLKAIPLHRTEVTLADLGYRIRNHNL